MIRTRLLCSFMAVALFCCASAWGSGFEYAGVGVQARAMGGAFRAMANDWTAAHYNPAGYAFQPDNALGGAWNFYHYRHELSPDYRLGGRFETGIFNDETIFNNHEILDVPSAGLVTRLPVNGDEMVFGLSAYQSFDYNITWNVFDPLTAYNSIATLPTDQLRNNLDVIVFQLSAARTFAQDKLALGVGLQILRGDLLFNNLVFRNNPLIAQDPSAEYTGRPYDKVPQLSRQDGDGWGFGVNAGFLYKLSEKMNVAATARFPFPVTVSGNASNEFVMPYIPSLLSTYNDGGVIDLFISGDLVVDSAEFETELTLPAAFSFGFSFSPIDRLVVNLDGEWTLWSRFEGFDFAYTNHDNRIGAADTNQVADAFFSTDLTNRVEWSDAGKLMLGAKYELVDNLMIMAGGSVDQSPARDARFMTPLLVDPGTKYVISAGALLNLKQWDLGFSTGFTSYPDRTIRGIQDKDGDTVADNFPGLYGSKLYETILAVNYRF